MTTYRNVQIIQSGNYLCTMNLLGNIGYEFKVLVQGNFEEDYVRLIKYLIDYVLDYQPKIEPEQTISYHSWLVKLNKTNDSHLAIWEASSNGEGFVEGIRYASKVINEQEEMCEKYDVTPVFPQFNQNVVISKGVYEGLGVDAVRYSSPDHMTGWWLTTDLYDDNIDSLMNVHYYHVAFNRPDLLKYVALPFGFRFYITEHEEDIWFDENAVD